MHKRGRNKVFCLLWAAMLSFIDLIITGMSCNVIITSFCKVTLPQSKYFMVADDGAIVICKAAVLCYDVLLIGQKNWFSL